ncbi:MAG: tRNA 2-selenouridine(34) synthase MnmH, partial [Flammeovirgaceae bacterium]|nr:tRNA 2-selenouridine(34) synthase MnmH [Flammeovirgaceae bacterium]
EEFFRLRNTLPVIDVRSEGEYAQGHIAGATNLPLLNNEERVIVGTTYKRKGPQEAIYEGFRLVGPRLKDIVHQAEKIAAKQEVLVHCWRGGMRSNNFCQFIGMAKVKSQALKGGYKAYRQFAADYFKKPLQLTLIGGCTGSGKSEVLRELGKQGEQILDLEALANHKGSAFGSLMQPPQPTTEQFHNDLFEKLFQLDLSKRIWIEDESITIGKVFLPPDFWATMKASPLVQMDVPKEIRIQRLVNEYGPADKMEFLAAMEKITKRLGGQHYKAAKEKWLEGDMATTIDILLTYYDKYYLGSIANKKERVKFALHWNGTNSASYAEMLRSETEKHLRSNLN